MYTYDIFLVILNYYFKSRPQIPIQLLLDKSNEMKTTL